MQELVNNQIEKAKRNGRTIDEPTAKEEVIADSMQTMLTYHNIFDTINTKSDNKLLNLIKSYLDRIHNLIAGFHEKYGKESEESKALKKNTEAFENAYDEFVKGLYAGGQNFVQQKNTADGGVRYSLKIEYSKGGNIEIVNPSKISKENIKQLLYDVKSQKIKKDSYVPVRQSTPKIIVNSLNNAGINVQNFPLVSQAKKIRQSLAKGSIINGKRMHSLTVDEYLSIIDNLDYPTNIIYQKNRIDNNGKQLPNNVAVFVNFSINNEIRDLIGEREGLAVIEFDAYIPSKNIGDIGEKSFNTVVTVFEPDTVRNEEYFDYLEELLENPNNEIIDIIKEETTNLEQYTRATLPVQEKSSLLNKNSITFSSESQENLKNDSENDKFRLDDRDDTEYLELAKNPEKNEVRLRELVDKAAKSNGYVSLMYHGSKKSDSIKVFNDWVYATKNQDYAQRYADKKLYTLYVKADRLFDTRKSNDLDLFNQAKNEYGLSDIGDRGLPDWTDGYDLSDYIDENNLDYDGIILDEGGDMVNGKPIYRGESYVIRKSSQTKSADLVTYDDNGKIIPLSERFKTDRTGDEAWKNEDIRFDDRDDVGDLKQSIVDKGEFFNESGAKKLTSELMKQYNIPREKRADLLSQILSVYQGFIDVAHKKETNIDVKKAFNDLGDFIFDNTREKKPVRTNRAQDIINYFKDITFKLDEQQIKEIEYAYGTLNDFRKKFFRKFNFSKTKGYNTDTYMAEINEMFPELIDPDTPSPEQPMVLAKAIDEAYGMYENNDLDITSDEYRKYISKDLIDKVYNLEISEKPETLTREYVEKNLTRENAAKWRSQSNQEFKNSILSYLNTTVENKAKITEGINTLFEAVTSGDGKAISKAKSDLFQFIKKLTTDESVNHRRNITYAYNLIKNAKIGISSNLFNSGEYSNSELNLFDNKDVGYDISTIYRNIYENYPEFNLNDVTDEKDMIAEVEDALNQAKVYDSVKGIIRNPESEMYQTDIELQGIIDKYCDDISILKGLLPKNAKSYKLLSDTIYESSIYNRIMSKVNKDYDGNIANEKEIQDEISGIDYDFDDEIYNRAKDIKDGQGIYRVSTKKDLSRILDAICGGDKELRAIFKREIEDKLYLHKHENITMIKIMLDRVMELTKKYNIKADSKEARLAQNYREGFKQIKSLKAYHKNQIL